MLMLIGFHTRKECHTYYRLSTFNSNQKASFVYILTLVWVSNDLECVWPHTEISLDYPAERINQWYMLKCKQSYCRHIFLFMKNLLYI